MLQKDFDLVMVLYINFIKQSGGGKKVPIGMIVELPVMKTDDMGIIITLLPYTKNSLEFPERSTQA
jgi:hypothetical protein